MIIDVVAADVRSWCELLNGLFHDVRGRVSRPADYNQELIDGCGRPLFLRVPEVGEPHADFHIYPPKVRRFQDLEAIAESLERGLLGRTIKEEEAEAFERLAMTARCCVKPEAGWRP